MYKEYFKRVFDLLVALPLMLILSPIFLTTSLLLALSLKENPVFLQKRPGKNGKIFRIVKLKTMNTSRDHAGNLLPDKRRTTRLGKFVRKTSLDEIPQLFNVLKGDMSLVGPRPLLPEDFLLRTYQERKRYFVRPGITGWAQINGRNNISPEEKYNFDFWYVNNLSLGLDLLIIWRTILKVLKSEGTETNTTATTEPFNGKTR